jgi:hypothetical protein
MGRERDMEKKFTENLDRILAGKEVPVDPSVDKELRDALDFARKMTAFGATPSAEYQARLKARLLQKLAEREALKKESSFWNIFRSRPVWQGVVAALFVIIIISVVWRAGFFQPSISPPAATTIPTTTAPATTASPTQIPAPSPATLVSVEAGTDKAAYQPGETVRIELAMKNVSQAPLTLDKMPPILSLMQAETGQPVYTFTAGSDTRTLAPNEVARYAYAWTQIDFKGRPVTGSYYVELEDLEYQGRPVQLNLSRPVRFEILPNPGNTGTSTIDVGQSQTFNNITVTLQRVTISDIGIMLNAFITPPQDYAVVQVGTGYRANRSYAAAAVYSFNRDWVQEAGVSAVEYLPNGMNHTWFILVIIPPGAGELYFETTDIGGWPGSWDFTIPLK